MCRAIKTVLGSLVVLLACSGGRPSGESTGGSPDFPGEYRNWKKINASTIMREAEREARDLYANQVALGRKGKEFPVGSVLVKEERMLAVSPSGQLRPGDVFRVSVMFKIGTGDMKGWKFAAFDPATQKELPRDRVDPDGCYFCHTDAEQNDYVFSLR